MTNDERVYGFSKPDARAIVEGIEGRQVAVPESHVRPTNARLRHAVTPSGGIPAKSGSTMGSATCDLYKANSSGVLASQSATATIYNPSTVAVAGSTAIMYGIDDAGLRVVIVESCS